MLPSRELREAFDTAASLGGAAGAERLCESCVRLLGVDGAAISLMTEGHSWGTLGASGDRSRRLDELQFTFGEGPCLDAVKSATPVLAPDLSNIAESRWPAFAAAALSMSIRAVFALPVASGQVQVGALDLYRHKPGALSEEGLAGGRMAAEAAAAPVLQVMRQTADPDPDGDGAQRGSAAWERVEVYQATGMIMGQLDVDNTEALVRLRGYAFAHGMTATEVARAVIARELRLNDDTEGHHDRSWS